MHKVCIRSKLKFWQWLGSYLQAIMGDPELESSLWVSWLAKTNSKLQMLTFNISPDLHVPVYIVSWWLCNSFLPCLQSLGAWLTSEVTTKCQLLVSYLDWLVSRHDQKVMPSLLSTHRCSWLALWLFWDEYFKLLLLTNLQYCVDRCP